MPDQLLKISPRACESLTDGQLEAEKQDLLAMLNDLKKMVEAGELMSIACAYQKYDGAVGTVFEIPVHAVTTLGAIRILEERVVELIKDEALKW